MDSVFSVRRGDFHRRVGSLAQPRAPPGAHADLYRALADQLERFLGVFEDRFEPTHGYLRRALAPAVYRYLDCGIFAHGAVGFVQTSGELLGYCGAAMRIVAFLIDFASLRRILAHLGFAPRPPSAPDATRSSNPPTQPLEPSSVSGPSCLSTLAQPIAWPRCTLPTESNFLHGTVH